MGKTTTAINLASSFAAAEVNTLLIDCDPQSNATSGLGLAKDPERISTYDLLMGAAAAEDALQPTELEQLWIIPAHKNLIGANLELVQAERREYRLRDALASLYQRFQFIVLDCPPALDLLTLNALVAADTVLIPMQAEYFALEGISELLDTVERIRASFNPDLGLEGVVLTMFDERTSLAKQVTAELKKYFSEKLCTTTIPRNIRLAEAPSHGKPALVYDVKSRGAESYIKLAKEIITHYMAEPGVLEQLASDTGPVMAEENVAALEAESESAAELAEDSGAEEVNAQGQDVAGEEPAAPEGPVSSDRENFPPAAAVEDVSHEQTAGEIGGSEPAAAGAEVATASDAVPAAPVEVPAVEAEPPTALEQVAQAAAAGVGEGGTEMATVPAVVQEIGAAGEAGPVQAPEAAASEAEAGAVQEMDKSA